MADLIFLATGVAIFLIFGAYVVALKRI